MHAIELAKTKFLRMREHLTRFERRPLNRAALTVVLFLDVFVLLSIFNGLDAHTRQLSAPDDFIPHFCRSIVLDGDWNSTNRTDKLSAVVNVHTNRHVRLEDAKKEVHQVCAPYRDLLEQITRDKDLQLAFENFSKANRELTDLQRRIGSMKGAYDTALLEKMAQQDQEQTDVSLVKSDVHTKTNSLNALTSQLASLELRINGNKLVVLLWERMDGLPQASRDMLREELRSAVFWYPFKKLVMQLAFLLPLLAVLAIWNNVSLKQERDVQILVSSHLVVIACIPIFVRIVSTLYDIIPKILLKQLIEWLEAFNLVAIWYYLSIGLAIGASLFFVYIFQKKLFSVEKTIERRVEHGQCIDCGKAVRPGTAFCWHCGVSLLKECKNCHQTTPRSSKYCVQCGCAQDLVMADTV